MEGENLLLVPRQGAKKSCNKCVWIPVHLVEDWGSYFQNDNLDGWIFKDKQCPDSNSIVEVEKLKEAADISLDFGSDVVWMGKHVMLTTRLAAYMIITTRLTKNPRYYCYHSSSLQEGKCARHLQTPGRSRENINENFEIFIFGKERSYHWDLITWKRW